MNKKAAIIIILIIIILLLAGVLVWLLVFRKPPRVEEVIPLEEEIPKEEVVPEEVIDFSNPRAVVEAYLRARIKGDREMTKKLVTDYMLTNYPETIEPLDEFSHFEIKKEEAIDPTGKEYTVTFYYKDLEKGSLERIYITFLKVDKWLVSAEEKPAEEIKTGSVEQDLANLEALQKSVDEGHQPWRLDPLEVARAEGTPLGFDQYTDKFTLISQVEKGEYSGTGEADVEAIHKGITYTIQLIQPARQGKEGIWVINNVIRK